jgi:hypothetical protein
MSTKMQSNPDKSPAGPWTKLESTGDVKRMLRWAILALKGGKLDAKNAAVMAQLANVLLRAIEGSNFAERLAALEARNG